MTPRYHAGKAVRECPKCGAKMEVGSRVKVQLCWEKGNRYKFASIGGFLCQDCAAKAAINCALEAPDSLYLVDEAG